MSQSPCSALYSCKVSFSPRSVICLHLYRARLPLLMLPFLYFVSNPRLLIPVEFIPVLVFSVAVLTSLGLALLRFPSIVLFVTRSFRSFPPSKAPPPPVVWSIGSKSKLQNCPKLGSSVQVYSDGNVYEGEFDGGKFSGSGVYYYNKSGRYEGDWVEGKYNGYGIETWAKGSKYRGQYRQGLRHGVGVYRFFTGDIYAGEWSNGQCHGNGVHLCEDESKYCGEFKWGVKHGLGRYNFRNGDTYEGEYFADKMHGFGVYHFANGHRYEGAWHEGRRQGFGIYCFKNGDPQCGHWNNGLLDAISKPSTGNTASTPFNLIHSKVLQAVQEARRKAEKAQSMSGVDERVNKAVTAANRSANAARVAAVRAVQKQIHQPITLDDLPLTLV